MRSLFSAFLAGSVVLAPACVTTTTRTTMSEAPAGPEATRRGRVEWVRQTVSETQGNPAAGAAAGAVVGGLLGGLITGHRMGALFGATTGAVIGADASQVHAEDTTYDVAVRFQDGETRIFAYRGYAPFRPGESVSLTAHGLVPAGDFAVSPPYRATPAPPAQAPKAGSDDTEAQPSAPQPGNLPPAPPAMAPAPPGPASQAAQVGVPAGQWVFTRQYGWVWMPYGVAYTFTPDYQNGDPYMYVYYPSAGWTWVDAPWLWGWGPMPFVRASGGASFVWYGHGWGERWQGRRPPRYRPWRR
jgi:outer membrane lipoprotein SlyB